MKLALYQVDAFARALFTGNPAAVCPLPRWLDDATLQAIAAENNLSETAFFVRAGDGYELRWFTPTAEVDLCGHATLASAYVIFSYLDRRARKVAFATRRAGTLTVVRRAGLLEMDFPAIPAAAVEAPPRLLGALGNRPVEVLATKRDYVAIFRRETDVARLTPDLAALKSLDRPGLAVSAPGDKVDFVVRFFAPALGIAEDPVTGSAFSTLVPYWAAALGRKTFRARQLSARGGDLRLALRGERVTIAGRCKPYLKGEIAV
jgi:PhzF family phenazine biosynthesis protein